MFDVDGFTATYWTKDNSDWRRVTSLHNTEDECKAWFLNGGASVFMPQIETGQLKSYIRPNTKEVK